MNPTDKLNELQRQIAEQKRIIDNCKHDWADTKYDPETVLEPYGCITRGQGSDVWTEAVGYHDLKKDRWSRAARYMA